MTPYSKSSLTLLATVIAFFAIVPTLVAQDDMRSTKEGVYTDEQATRGEELMWNVCAECHFEEDYQGAFIEDWSGASVWSMFESIYDTMPEDNPGGLPLTDYSDAIAYIFRLNGIPAGDEELGTEQSVLEKIKIEWEPEP